MDKTAWVLHNCKFANPLKKSEDTALELPQWDIEIAKSFVRELAPKVRPYQLSIVGGVASQGRSDHDLDIKVDGRGGYANLNIFAKKLQIALPGTHIEFAYWVEGSNIPTNITLTLQDGRIVDFVTGWLDPLDEMYRGTVTPIKAQWTLKNCKFASCLKEASISGTPKGDKKYGCLGYSRAYDLAVHQFEDRARSFGMIASWKGPYETRFAFSKDSPPDHQVSISWAEGDTDCGTKIRIIEVGKKAGPMDIVTDTNHLSITGSFIQPIEHAIRQALKKSGKPWIGDRARYGFGPFIGGGGGPQSLDFNIP